MRHIAILAAGLFGAITVVDGDTVKMDGKTYRLLGFDTPETYWSRCAREREMGKAATLRMEELVAAGAILETTNRSCKWRRKCGRLYLHGEDAADIMIREGHAVPYNGRGPRKDWCS